MPDIDEFQSIIDTPFPQNTRARISIIGLAHCKLSPAESKINFLTHVPNHDLTMTVVKRLRDSPFSIYPAKHYKILDGEAVSVDILTGDPPLHLKTQGPYPLIAMVNLGKVHNDDIEPHPQAPPAAVLTLKKCAFYTMLIYPSTFKLVEDKPKGIEIPRDEIGFVLGGDMPRKDPTEKVTITIGILPPIELPGTHPDLPKDPPELVYDIIFNNHCTDRARCKAQVTKPNADGNMIPGTDFFFYYDALQQKGNVHRRFNLVDGTVGTRLRTSPFESDSGTGEVAACNPVIVSPPEPYD